MVRVNCSPGGGGPLTETVRAPKTVRVLKPPGGGSSISFGDDPQPVRKNSAPVKVEKEIVKPEEPKAVTQDTTEEVAKDNIEAEAAPVEKPAKESQKEVNGTNPIRNDSPPPVENLTLSETNGHTGSEPETALEDCSPKEVKQKPDLPPLKIETPQPSSPPSSPPASTNGNTTPCNTNNSLGASPLIETTPRKVKDHMRSNIFESSTQDFTPTRSSRLNAQVASPEPVGLSTAGQRGRIPPGGFSTKLW